MASYNRAISQAIKQYADRPALLSQDGQTISFARLGVTIAALTTRLAVEGVTAGQCILPLVDNRALRICLRFALSRLGVVVLQTTLTTPSQEAGKMIDAVIAFEDQDTGGFRKLVFHQDWLEGAADSSFTPVEPGEVIFASSGSTGFAKQMKTSPAALLASVYQFNKVAGPSAGAIYISIPDHTQVSSRFMLRALLAGHAVMGPQGTTASTLKDAQALGVKEMMLTPMALHDMIEAVKAGAPAGQVVRIFVGGATASVQVLSAAAACFGAEIHIIAGATEVGFYSHGLFDSTDFEQGWSGKLNPWVQAEVRGKGEYLRHGPKAGRLAIRVAQERRAQGYLGGVEAFDPGGWFETGDIVTISPDRDLHIGGRADYLINLSGSKFAPELVEMIAAQSAGVGQVAAVMLEGIGTTVAELGIAVVATEGFEAAPLQVLLAAKLGTPAKIRVIQVSALPRLPSGKLSRSALVALFSPEPPDLE